ncbi:MAG: hypothetical protein IJQ23_01855 [Clostridia bacterium]|nr:hypothetical protein [Clostridia bacterium]
MKKTLEQIIEEERKHRHEDGQFGIKACKEHILFCEKEFHESLFKQLEDNYKRTDDPFFNNAMVLACWELINGQN